MIVRFLCLCIYLFPLASAIQIFAGTTALGGINSQCGNIQEFSCIHDICDPYAGVAHNGRCRNGDDSSGTCQPNAACSVPTPGHCLENTISAAGIHSMPSNKHFYCVSVTEFDKATVIWANSDCTGRSCFIPGNGDYNTWALGVQGNCIDVGVEVPTNTTPCLSPGQTGLFPPNGGFPSSIPEPVGGEYGLPVAFLNSHSCDQLSASVEPAAIPQNTTGPKAGDFTDWWHSNVTITDGDTSELDTRELVDRQGKQPSTKALRDGMVSTFAADLQFY